MDLNVHPTTIEIGESQNPFYVSENVELVNNLINIALQKKFGPTIQTDNVENYNHVFRELQNQINEEYHYLPLVEKNKHLIASLFAYCKQIYISTTKKDRTILERNYEQNKEDFQSYAPKVPEQVDFSIKENEITEEMKQNVKENYDTIMKQRQEELNNITFNKQQNVQATEWINKDKDAEEEEEQAEQKKEEAITENRKYEATQ